VPVGESLQYNKWTVLCINGAQVLEDNHVFAAGQKASFFMRSLQVTANVQIRGIYTSDMRYTVGTLPKDMALKILKGQDWFSQYAWIEYPAVEGDAPKENNSTNTSSKQRARPSKQVKFHGDKPPVVIVTEEEKVSHPTIISSEEQTLPKQEEIIEKTVRDIEDIKA
jgi:WD40 repeat protein